MRAGGEDGHDDDPLRGCRDAFTVKAPFFASTDERQRRLYNPVTGLTLLGKCAALLPPAVVTGRSVLDLGACLGAMCHWAMCGCRAGGGGGGTAGLLRAGAGDAAASERHVATAASAEGNNGRLGEDGGQ